MVHLSRIYTKSGDTGTTQLGDGSTLPKHHLRVSAYGNVDELNSVIGLMLVHGVDGPTAERLRQIQNDLFDVGSDLCVPGEAGEKLRITAAYAERLEGWIDEVNQALRAHQLLRPSWRCAGSRVAPPGENRLSPDRALHRRVVRA